MPGRVKCDVCGRSWYASMAGPCHKKPEKSICMYCCLAKCKNGYRDGNGVRCRVADQEKAKGTVKQD